MDRHCISKKNNFLFCATHILYFPRLKSNNHELKEINFCGTNVWDIKLKKYFPGLLFSVVKKTLLNIFHGSLFQPLFNIKQFFCDLFFQLLLNRKIFFTTLFLSPYLLVIVLTFHLTFIFLLSFQFRDFPSLSSNIFYSSNHLCIHPLLQSTIQTSPRRPHQDHRWKDLYVR